MQLTLLTNMKTTKKTITKSSSKTKKATSKNLSYTLAEKKKVLAETERVMDIKAGTSEQGFLLVITEGSKTGSLVTQGARRNMSVGRILFSVCSALNMSPTDIVGFAIALAENDFDLEKVEKKAVDQYKKSVAKKATKKPVKKAVKKSK